uniref:Lipoprotein n=1 Tax=Anguilla anguilla TaxID=7936 RepID=A0A0E9PXX8_ANGAN
MLNRITLICCLLVCASCTCAIIDYFYCTQPLVHLSKKRTLFPPSFFL